MEPIGEGRDGRLGKDEFDLFMWVSQGGKDELSLMIVC